MIGWSHSVPGAVVSRPSTRSPRPWAWALGALSAARDLDLDVPVDAMGAALADRLLKRWTDSPGPTFETAMLSMIHRNRADILTREGRTSEAVEAMKLANDLSPWINKGPGEPGRPKSQSRGFGRPGSPDR